MFDKIKYYYSIGLYTDAQVAMFVKKGIITPEQYTDITGKEYEA